MNWQPIATAPIDGTPVLIWDTHHGVDIAYYSEKWNLIRAAECYPRYWMPLPPEP